MLRFCAQRRSLKNRKLAIEFLVKIRYTGREKEIEVISMSTCETLLASLRSGAHDGVLSKLYAPDGSSHRLDRARARAVHVVEEIGRASCRERV